jgi:hypothetical protein
MTSNKINEIDKRQLNQYDDKHDTLFYVSLIFSLKNTVVHSSRNLMHWSRLVEPETNYDQTQCFPTHLTTFPSSFVVFVCTDQLELCIFANADFMKNKTIYLTVICTCVAYIIVMIYARFEDIKKTV